ncbi:MAG: hypothetical protein IH845_03095 [Nanoarchaeota archaeon]|nr:hypothetical protein [Nanoarchaeota archaeon]
MANLADKLRIGIRIKCGRANYSDLFDSETFLEGYGLSMKDIAIPDALPPSSNSYLLVCSHHFYDLKAEVVEDGRKVRITGMYIHMEPNRTTARYINHLLKNSREE